jgi:hypothetical protein
MVCLIFHLINDFHMMSNSNNRKREKGISFPPLPWPIRSAQRHLLLSWAHASAAHLPPRGLPHPPRDRARLGGPACVRRAPRSAPAHAAQPFRSSRRCSAGPARQGANAHCTSSPNRPSRSFSPTPPLLASTSPSASPAQLSESRPARSAAAAVVVRVAGARVRSVFAVPRCLTTSPR